MVKDYEYAEGVQTVIVENNSPYFVKTDLIKNGEPVGYLNLPSHSKTENLIYDENLSSCENKIYGVYEMDIEKPQVAYIYGYVCGRLYAAGKDRCKGKPLMKSSLPFSCVICMHRPVNPFCMSCMR